MYNSYLKSSKKINHRLTAELYYYMVSEQYKNNFKKSQSYSSCLQVNPSVPQKNPKILRTQGDQICLQIKCTIFIYWILKNIKVIPRIYIGYSISWFQENETVPKKNRNILRTQFEEIFVVFGCILLWK